MEDSGKAAAEWRMYDGMVCVVFYFCRMLALLNTERLNFLVISSTARFCSFSRTHAQERAQASTCHMI